VTIQHSMNLVGSEFDDDGYSAAKPVNPDDEPASDEQIARIQEYRDAFAVFSDARVQLICSYGSAGGTFGILGRQADDPNDGNHWEVVVTNANTVDPVLSIREISGNAIVATRASVVLTGEGPFTGNGTGAFYAGTIEMECLGTLITGRMWTPVYGTLYEISYTSTTYQTQKYWGFRLSGDNAGWIDDFKIYNLEPYPVLAKHLNESASPGNYYRSTQYNGLIPASGSGDQWLDLTLVFCVHLNEYADAALFDEAGHHFFIRCIGSGSPEVPGSFWFGGTEASTGQLRSVLIDATGSPSSGSVWAKDAWHAVMISVAGDQSGSPQSSVVTIWVDGVEVYSGGYNLGSVPANRPLWNPMGYSSASKVFAGFGPSGSGFTEGGLDSYLSYVWAKETTLDPATNWNKFFDENNKPRWLGLTGERVTGAAADSYFPNGDFTDNWGTGPNWTEIGTVADAPSSPSD